MSYSAFSMFVDGELTWVSYAFVKKNTVRYMRPHGRFAHCSYEMPILASCIEIYIHFFLHACNFCTHFFNTLVIFHTHFAGTRKEEFLYIC